MATFIIAEAGVNHNGNLDMALGLVRAAHSAGADAVKFQTFRAEDLVTPSAPQAPYQEENDKAASQLEMLKRLELSESNHRTIIEECKRLGIMFISTPFSLRAARFLDSMDMKIWKLSSGDLTNLPLLEFVASTGKPIILSTGMATEDEVAAAVSILTNAGTVPENIALLHCTTAYPTPPSEANLKAMHTLQRINPRGATGYSDHTAGIAVPIAAVAMGARIIEKHFTLDRNLPGPDHKASLTPDELTEMISNIRTVEKAMGDGTKQPTDAEKPNAPVARKSIVAASEIAPGEKFTTENLTTKRPGTGISPMLWHEIMGRKARHAYCPEQLINPDELQ